jgi:biotin carboxyl carrier protein
MERIRSRSRKALRIPAMKFSVRAGGKEYQIRFDEAYGKRVLEVDGVAHRLTLLRVDGSRVRFTVDDRPVEAVVSTSDDVGILTVDAGAGSVDLEIEESRFAQVRKISGLAQSPPGMLYIKAPMPGLVTQVMVKVGDTVTTGTPILVMEAMKMENEIRASGDGVVTEITVRPQEAVDQGRTLVSFKPLEETA